MNVSKFLLLCTVLLLTPLVMPAADAPRSATSPAGSAESPSAKPKRDWYPFYGYVAVVDAQGKTISLKKKEGGRVLRLDEKSIIEVGGKAATIREVKVGDYARGKLRKDKTGAEVIVSAKFDKEAVKRSKTGTTTPK